MHLINTQTLTLEYFSSGRPQYAILSHTWGPEEVTFADFSDIAKRESLAGFAKIKTTCDQARRDGLDYAWVDTCCINKESSAELSEAINSMFRWYGDAVVCYAFLEDLDDQGDLPITDPSVLKRCRWFSRGWTLQELIAPRKIIFYGSSWNKVLGDDASTLLEQVTGIASDVLRKEKSLAEVSVANRMNWAAARETSREEDIAYCLMGLFDVNMPMLYGEGSKAFLRLQEEIVKHIKDDSLFAWQATAESAVEAPFRGLFASSPAEFTIRDKVTPFHPSMAGPISMLSNGQVSLSATFHSLGDDKIIGLKCFRGNDVSKTIGIHIIRTEGNVWLRCSPSALPLCSHGSFTTIVFQRHARRRTARLLADDLGRDGVCGPVLSDGIRAIGVHPPEFREIEMTDVLPVADLLRRTAAFELGIGVADFEYEDGAPLVTDEITALLLIWVEPILGSRLYNYYISLQTVPSNTSIESFINAAERPLLPAEDHTVVVGAWTAIQITCQQRDIGGRNVLVLELQSFVDEALLARRRSEVLTAVADEQAARQERDSRRRADEREERERSNTGVWGYIIITYLGLILFFSLLAWLAPVEPKRK